MEEEKTYITKGFIMSFWAGIFIALNVSSVLMFLFLMMGLGPILTSLAFIVSLYFLITGLSGETIYKVNSTGISQSIFPSKLFSFFKKPIQRAFNWSEIESAEEGWDLTRKGNRFEYLHLSVSKKPGSLRISDEMNTKSFIEFRTEVLRKINEFNNPETKSDPILLNIPIIKSPESKVEPRKPIKIKKSFYERPIAKIVTIFFIFLTLGLVVYSFFFGVRGTNWFRLEYILIPGTGYMFWRVFINKK